RSVPLSCCWKSPPCDGMAAIELLMQQSEQAQTHLQMALALLQAPLPQDHPAASALAVKLMTHLGNALAAQARHTERLFGN
ncbi:hypothetical protein, partial [Thiorhodospira sibirica]|uniref:hypothetical protein n=1 Tax=Thiorhodospira sibirica TaxID=154347 RepID=UPI001C8E64C7